MKPQNEGVLLLRAAVYQESKQPEKALADVNEVLRRKPEVPAAMRLRAVLLADLGKFAEAITDLERLRELNPEDLQTDLQLGMLYTADKKYELAIEAYSAVLAENPEQPIALQGRGDALLNQGKHKQAVADYEKGLQLAPKNVSLLNNLAWVLATSPEEKLRDGKRAITMATEACEQTQYEQPHILSTLAAAYAETGDFESAIKWAEKGLEIAHENQKESLSKELASYRERKPWRELLADEEEEERNESAEPSKDEPKNEPAADSAEEPAQQ
jgi:tetratricopeptide (TPR) repeat protein